MPQASEYWMRRQPFYSMCLKTEILNLVVQVYDIWF